MPSSAASKALVIACLLLPARAASPITVTLWPGRASRRNARRWRGAPDNRTSRAAPAWRTVARSPARARARWSSIQFGDRAEAEAISGAARDDDAVERRQQFRAAGHVGRVAEHHAFDGAGGRQIVDIAIEAVVVRLDLLEQRRLAGVTEGAAGARVLLEHGHRVAGRRPATHRSGRPGRRRSPRCARRCGGCASAKSVSRPAAPLTTQPMRAPPRISLMQVLQARQRRIGSPRAHFLDPLRIGDQRAAECDEIGLAARRPRLPRSPDRRAGRPR